MAERRFIAMRVEAENLARLVSEPDAGLILNLERPIDAYDPYDPADWTIVSHAFTIEPHSGAGILSFVFERRERS